MPRTGGFVIQLDTLETYDYGFLMEIRPDQYCLDFATWCEGITSDLLGPLDPSSPDFAVAWVNANSLCYVAQDVLDQTSAMVVATGALTVRYSGEGEERNVNRVELVSNLNSASLAIADSLAVGDPTAEGELYNFAYTDTDELCDYLGVVDGPWPNMLCQRAAGQVEVLGTAEATSRTVGAGSGIAGGLGSSNADVTVHGSNIRKLKSAVNAAAEHFSFADSKGTVDAIAKVYMEAYSTSFSQTCFEFVNTQCEYQCSVYYSSAAAITACVVDFCVSDFCNFGVANELLNVTNVAESLAEAVAISFSHTAFSFKSHLTFDLKDEDMEIADAITFGYDGKGWTGANSTVACQNLSGKARKRGKKDEDAPIWWGFES